MGIGRDIVTPLPRNADFTIVIDGKKLFSYYATFLTIMMRFNRFLKYN